MRWIFFVMLITPGVCFAQKKLIKGMVVDSTTLVALNGVHVIVANSGTASTTDGNGIFAIVAFPNDTLTFSFVGYSRATRAIDLDEEIMFVRLKDESILLKEIIIRDTPLFGKSRYINSPTLSTVRPQAAFRGNGVNLAYFSKMEKEKRKLVAVIAELEQARKYIEIVTDPDFRNGIMEKYHLPEDRYYELLANFNQTHAEVIHSSNESQILYALFSFFEYVTLKR